MLLIALIDSLYIKVEDLSDFLSERAAERGLPSPVCSTALYEYGWEFVANLPLFPDRPRPGIRLELGPHSQRDSWVTFGKTTKVELAEIASKAETNDEIDELGLMFITCGDSRWDYWLFRQVMTFRKLRDSLLFPVLFDGTFFDENLLTAWCDGKEDTEAGALRNIVVHGNYIREDLDIPHARYMAEHHSTGSPIHYCLLPIVGRRSFAPVSAIIYQETLHHRKYTVSRRVQTLAHELLAQYPGCRTVKVTDGLRSRYVNRVDFHGQQRFLCSRTDLSESAVCCHLGAQTRPPNGGSILVEGMSGFEALNFYRPLISGRDFLLGALDIDHPEFKERYSTHTVSRHNSTEHIFKKLDAKYGKRATDLDFFLHEVEFDDETCRTIVGDSLLREAGEALAKYYSEFLSKELGILNTLMASWISGFGTSSKWFEFALRCNGKQLQRFIRLTDEGVIDGFSLLDIDPLMKNQAVSDVLRHSRHRFGEYPLDRLGSRVQLTNYDQRYTMVSSNETDRLAMLINYRLYTLFRSVFPASSITSPPIELGLRVWKLLSEISEKLNRAKSDEAYLNFAGAQFAAANRFLTAVIPVEVNESHKSNPGTDSISGRSNNTSDCNVVVRCDRRVQTWTAEKKLDDLHQVRITRSSD